MKSNTGLGLIKTTIERVENEKSLFASALKKLVNSSEDDLRGYLERVDWNAGDKSQSAGKKIIRETACLRLVPSMKGMPVKELDGTRTLASAKDSIFKRHCIYTGDFGYYDKPDLNRPGVKTDATNLSMYELVSDAQTYWIFNSFGTSLENLWMTQDQVIEFCLSHLVSFARQRFLKDYQEFYFFALLKKDEKKPAWKDNLILAKIGVVLETISIKDEKEFADWKKFKDFRHPLHELNLTYNSGYGIGFSSGTDEFTDSFEFSPVEFDMGITYFVVVPQQLA